MLKPVQKGTFKAGSGEFVILAARYNAEYVDAMLQAALAELKQAGARARVLRVPGAYEIPLLAAILAAGGAKGNPRAKGRTSRPSAIICLGVILRGETVHAAHIGEAVSRALMEIQLEYFIPVIHEVLLLENRQQAQARCLGTTHNRGAEAAQTALAMAEVLRLV
jgi:6,7-dimethyl-8-ribityllumazine synthase